MDSNLIQVSRDYMGNKYLERTGNKTRNPPMKQEEEPEAQKPRLEEGAAVPDRA
jgi:hypothetical protein